MSAAPAIVRIKRRREQEPLPALLLDAPPNKAKRQRVEYRLQTILTDQTGTSQGASKVQPNRGQPSATLPLPSASEKRDTESKDTTGPTPAVVAPPRQFQLQRKRGAEMAGFATFVERKQQKGTLGDRVVSQVLPQDGQASSSGTSTPQKRPGANAQEKQWRAETWKERDKISLKHGYAEPPKDHDQGLADALHQFALEEAAYDEAEEKPKIKFQPKRAVRRLKDRNPKEAARGQPQVRVQDEDTDMDAEMSDDEEYVYDIYIRQQRPSIVLNPDSTVPAAHSIGYLVITEQDEQLWETYLEDEEEDKEWDSEDEDENAEGYYGADYPEDEVASDDEFNRGAYGYRRGGSDEEQWDSDTGAWSDDEDAMRNPWKKYPWQEASKRAGGSVHGSEDGAE